MADTSMADTSIYSPLMKPVNPMEQTNNLLDTVAKRQQVQSNAIGIDKQQMELAMQKLGILRGTISSYLGDPGIGRDDLTPKIARGVVDLVKNGVLTAAHATEALKNIPTDPREQYVHLRNLFTQTQDAIQKGQNFQGSVSAVPDQAGTRIVQVPGYPGLPGQDRGYVPNQLPADTQTIGPDNKTRLLGPAGPPGLQQPSPLAPTMPQRRQVAAPAPGASGAGSGLVTKLAPDQAASLEKTGAGSGMELSDARHRSLNFQQEVFPLEQAIPALEKLGTKGTGPGTESINHLKSFVLSNIPGADFKGLKDDVATYDKAKKYLTDFVNQNGNSGTNDKLAASFAGNPSVNISNAAAVDVAKSALALRRMKQAQLVAFEHSGLPESDYAKFASKWNAHADPRAYGFDLMSSAQRKATLESLPKGKRELFMLNVQDAAENGMIRAPK